MKVSSWDGFKWYIEKPQHKLVLNDGERTVLTFLKLVSNKDLTFIDIGAYVGSYCIRLSKYYNMIIAVEPNPESVKILKKNLELNNIHNVKIIECALADYQGEAILNLRGGSSTLLADYKGKGKVKVKVDMLDNIIDHVDVMKIDVEGYEERVVRGALNTIKKCKPVIVIEHHENREYKELKGMRERIRKLLSDYISINLNGVHYAYIPKGYDLTKIKDALVWHYINLVVKNLEEGKPWYYSLPRTWWYGAGVTDFILALPDHILKEEEWIKRIIEG